MNIISYYNTSNLVQENVDDLTDINLAQTKNNVNIVLSSYEDLLYQMYTACADGFCPTIADT